MKKFSKKGEKGRKKGEQMKSGKKKRVEKKEKKEGNEKNERTKERKKEKLRRKGLEATAYIKEMAQFPTWEGQSACPDDGDQWLWSLGSIGFH